MKNIIFNTPVLRPSETIYNPVLVLFQEKMFLSLGLPVVCAILPDVKVQNFSQKTLTDGSGRQIKSDWLPQTPSQSSMIGHSLEGK